MRLRSLRLTVQVIFFLATWMGLFIGMTGLIYPYYFCTASPGACATCPILILEHSATLDLHAGILLLYLIAFMGFIGMLFGRAFCGWACPVGFTQEIMYHVGQYVRPLLRTVDKSAKSLGEYANFGVDPKYFKYGILILIPLTSLVTGKLVFTSIDPIGALTASIPALMTGNYTTLDWFWVKILLLIFFFVMVTVVMRAWCRWLCPIGAMLAPTNKLSILHLEESEENKCLECGLCARNCPMHIKLPKNTRDMECILCGRCVQSCPTNRLQIKFLGKKIF